jgi:hypothetical protein
MIAVNVHNMTGALRVIQKRRFLMLVKRYLRLKKRYQDENEKITMEYRKYAPVFYSLDFWIKYLGLEK